MKTFLDLVECPICKSYVKKKDYRWHKQDHKYDYDGRLA